MGTKGMESARDGRKVIFLDIDGVLQPGSWQYRFEHDLEELRRNLAEKYQDDEYLLVDRYDIGAVTYDWYPDAVANLKTLIERTGAEIVVSSDWRRSKILNWLKLLFRIHGLDGFIKDVTPDMSYHREEEIYAYLTSCNDVAGFVVIDDMNLLKGFPDNFVWVTRGYFNSDQLDMALKILVRKPAPAWMPNWMKPRRRPAVTSSKKHIAYFSVGCQWACQRHEQKKRLREERRK